MMRQYSGIGTAPTKAPYQKSQAILELERLANEQARRDHPEMDPRFLAPRTFRDDDANSLTGCIVKYITLQGGFASRVNNQGTYNQRLKKYIPSTSRKGLADVLATYHGDSLMVEVKYGADKLSEHQKKIRYEQEKSGGYYYVARNFSEFKF